MAANRYAGTKTEKNLWEAFAGESQARNKYTFFASVAKKAGYEQIAALFQKTADNEREHAKLWFRQLGQIGTTEENLGILILPPREKTMSGRICMIVWRRKPTKKASRNSPLSSAAWLLLKRPTKSAIASC